MFKSFILFFVIGLTGAFAADCNGDWRFDELYFNEQIVGYYLNAIDLETGTQNFDLFRYRIYNADDSYDPSDEFWFEFVIEIYSPQLGFEDFTQFGVLQAHVSNIQHELLVRNTDISGDTQVAGALVDEVTWESIDLADDQYDAFTSVILQNGRLPDGVYNFISRIHYNGSVSCELVETLEVYEPQYLELLGPGSEYNSEDEPEVHTTYPVFSWNSDYCAEISGESKCSLGIRVCEYKPGIHNSVSDAINDMSVLPLDQSEDFFPLPGNLKVFQYPTTAAMELESGHTYVWQLKRGYDTTLGLGGILSDIYIFKVDVSPGISSASDPFLAVLRDLIGEASYTSIFGPGGELEGYAVEGQVLLKNGQEMPLMQIRNILTEINQDQRQITNVEVQP